jgi:hypothetical protein
VSYEAGDTYYATLTVRDIDDELVDPTTLALRVRDHEGEVTAYEWQTDDIVVRDSIGEFHADVPLTAAGMWAIDWTVSDESEVEGVQIAVSPAPTAGITFATLDQLAIVLDKTDASEFTAAQAAKGAMLLELVTANITDGVGKTAAWAQTLSPIPAIIRSVCLAVVARVMRPTINNPDGVSSQSETLGQWSHTTRYGENGAAGAITPDELDPTDEEMRKCRRAVWGHLSATTMPATTLDLAIELYETGELAAFPDPAA